MKIDPVRAVLSLVLTALILIAAPLIRAQAKPASTDAPASADAGMRHSSSK